LVFIKIIDSSLMPHLHWSEIEFNRLIIHLGKMRPL
jgi:hypothetical protein